MSPRRRTAIVMSRLPRLIDPRAAWLRGLRAALRRVQQLGDTLVVVDGTAGAELVRRGAERLAIPVEVIQVADDPGSVSTATESEDTIPQRDRVLIGSAQTVVVLGVRTNGNVHRALREHLANGGHVELADLDELQSRAVRDDLIGRGALLWSLGFDDHSPVGVAVESATPRRTDSVYEIVPFPSPGEWIFLSHTTRACAGPWPEQTQTDYVDSVLDGTSDADHSPVAALERILTQQRLLASPRTNRGGHAVVCFTAVPLLDLPSLRQFRTHRSRWDFEPFGLCLDRQWLHDRGARPVIYGDEATWQSLPDADRPFFQLTHPTDRAKESSAQLIDWSVEREWRHVGDLDLRELKPDQALVFVPRFAAAMRMAEVSPWPITLWPDPSVIDTPIACD